MTVLRTADGKTVTQEQATQYARRLYARTQDPKLYGHVHIFDPSYGVNSVATKRWSSAYHGIPSMSESKMAFVSRFDGGLFGKCDFSQHELRIIAALCKDPNMMQAFIDNKDLHRMVASKMYHIEEEDVTANQRAVAKSANFGLVYLKTPESFAVDYLNNDVQQAIDLFNTIFTLFPLLKSWRDEQIAKLHQIMDRSPVDYVRFPIYTLWGDPIWHEFDRTKKMDVIDAERYAVNWQIQSTASNLAGLAAAETDTWLKDNSKETVVTGFIHDCEEFDLYMPELFDMMDQVPKIAEEYLFKEFGLPVQIDVELGPTLGNEIEVKRLKGNKRFLDDDGNIVATLDGSRDDVLATIERIGRVYDLELGEHTDKEVKNSWKDVFSIKGCYYSGMGKTDVERKVPIKIFAPA